MTVINESGLYSLVLGSKLPGAKQFKRWITREVIPSIRKHGYSSFDRRLQRLGVGNPQHVAISEKLPNVPFPAGLVHLDTGV